MTTTANTPEFNDRTFQLYFDWCVYHASCGSYNLQKLLCSKPIKNWWVRMMKAREPILLDVLYECGHEDVWERDFLTKQVAYKTTSTKN